MGVAGGSFLKLPRFGKGKEAGSGTTTPSPAAPNPIYEAESPDELSLVFAAKGKGPLWSYMTFTRLRLLPVLLRLALQPRLRLERDYWTNTARKELSLWRD